MEKESLELIKLKPDFKKLLNDIWEDKTKRKDESGWMELLKDDGQVLFSVAKETIENSPKYEDIVKISNCTSNIFVFLNEIKDIEFNIGAYLAVKYFEKMNKNVILVLPSIMGSEDLTAGLVLYYSLFTNYKIYTNDKLKEKALEYYTNLPEYLKIKSKEYVELNLITKLIEDNIDDYVCITDSNISEEELQKFNMSKVFLFSSLYDYNKDNKIVEKMNNFNKKCSSNNGLYEIKYSYKDVKMTDSALCETIDNLLNTSCDERTLNAFKKVLQDLI